MGAKLFLSQSGNERHALLVSLMEAIFHREACLAELSGPPLGILLATAGLVGCLECPLAQVLGVADRSHTPRP